MKAVYRTRLAAIDGAHALQMRDIDFRYYMDRPKMAEAYGRLNRMSNLIAGDSIAKANKALAELKRERMHARINARAA